MDIISLVTMLMVLGVAVGVVALGLYGVSYLKKKGILTDQNIEATKRTLEIVEMILKSVNFNDKAKNQTEKVFNIADVAVKYVEQTMKNENNDLKKSTAFDTTIEILKTLNIDITDDVKTLVEFGIESAVSTLPKTSKTLMI